MNIRLNASDDIVVAYLENLWKTNKVQQVVQVANNINNTVEQPIKVVLTVNNQLVEQQIKVELNVNNQQVEQQVESVNAETIPNISTNNKEEFSKQVKENLRALRDIGFRVYHNILPCQ